MSDRVTPRTGGATHEPHQGSVRTMGEARRAAGIPESDYLRHGDSVDRISTVRCLARIFGPPDHRYEHLDCCSLDWTVGRDKSLTVVVKPNGAITS